MRFAVWWFRIAGVYGLVVTLALYFREPAGAPLTHPEFYYGFAGAAAVMQLAYLLVSTDPVRYRPVMLLGILSKLSFAIPCALLYAHGRMGADMLIFAAIDLALAAGFAVAWAGTRRPA
jgi:hypothetical protein